MSKVTIQGDASGTGIFTRASPNSNTDRTLVLPDEAGTVLTTAGVPASAMPAGSVIQVVQTVKSDTFSTTGTSFVEITGYNVTITPASSSNKVMVEVCLHIGEGQDAFPAFRMYRNGTELQTASAIGSGTSAMFGKTTTGNDARDALLLEPVNFKFLDSPNTTDAITYTIRVRPMGTISRTVYVNRCQTYNDSNQYTVISTFTATEIAG